MPIAAHLQRLAGSFSSNSSQENYAQVGPALAPQRTSRKPLRAQKAISPSAAPTELRLALPGIGLDPAERFLDTLADTQTDGITAMSRRALVNRRAATVCVMRHMWWHRHRA